jgi:hypothetical protein
MKTGMFLAEIDLSGKIEIPVEIRDRLSLIEVIIRKNPLHKILLLPELKEPTTQYD